MDVQREDAQNLRSHGKQGVSLSTKLRLVRQGFVSRLPSTKLATETAFVISSSSSGLGVQHHADGTPREISAGSGDEVHGKAAANTCESEDSLTSLFDHGCSFQNTPDGRKIVKPLPDQSIKPMKMSNLFKKRPHLFSEVASANAKKDMNIRRIRCIKYPIKGIDSSDSGLGSTAIDDESNCVHSQDIVRNNDDEVNFSSLMDFQSFFATEESGNNRKEEENEEYSNEDTAKQVIYDSFTDEDNLQNSDDRELVSTMQAHDELQRILTTGVDDSSDDEDDDDDEDDACGGIFVNRQSIIKQILRQKQQQSSCNPIVKDAYFEIQARAMELYEASHDTYSCRTSTASHSPEDSDAEVNSDTTSSINFCPDGINQAWTPLSSSP